LGAPGVGKGTQAQLLSAELGACQLSTGDIFRAAKMEECGNVSPDMAAALDCMRKGELVPDQTVLNLIRERSKCLHCRGGFLLDGFPRTVAQARALDKILGDKGVRLDAVVDYELPIQTIVARLGGRRTCSDCKAVYHIAARPPNADGICDQCGGQLFQREDDRPEAVRVRMQAYDESTRPLIDYYQERGLLVSISAEGSPEEIYRRTIDGLG
jgi:adenylate kinase